MGRGQGGRTGGRVGPSQVVHSSHRPGQSQAKPRGAQLEAGNGSRAPEARRGPPVSSPPHPAHVRLSALPALPLLRLPTGPPGLAWLGLRGLRGWGHSGNGLPGYRLIYAMLFSTTCVRLRLFSEDRGSDSDSDSDSDCPCQLGVVHLSIEDGRREQVSARAEGFSEVRRKTLAE